MTNNKKSLIAVRTNILRLLSLAMIFTFLVTLTPASGVCLQGDATGDCKVDMYDLEMMLDQWLSTVQCVQFDCADLDYDKQVNISDLAILADHWGQETSPLVVSEFMAVNSTVLSTTVNGVNMYPDWIEIYNQSGQAVSLAGWYLTDSDNNMTKWPFPSGLVIQPGGYLVVFASNKEQSSYPENYPYLDSSGNYHTNFQLQSDGEYLALVRPDLTAAHEYSPKFPEQFANVSYGLAGELVNVPFFMENSNARYLVPSNDSLGTAWQSPSFDDSSWLSGYASIGYDTENNYDPLIVTDVQSSLYNQQSSIYVRIPFTVDDPSKVSDLNLQMKYDDGFAAFLNGQEIASRNAYPLLAPMPGLVGYWALDETSGVDAADGSTNSNDGTVTNTTFDAGSVTGKFGNALQLDGADDYINVPDHSSLNPTSAITVSAWIKADTWGTGYWSGSIVSKEEWSGAPSGYVLRCGDNGKLSFSLGIDGSFPQALSGPVMSTGTWYHVVGTYDGSRIKVYINGQEEDSTPETRSIPVSTYPVNIGQTSYVTDRLFDGAIDEVSIWDRALTTPEIDYLYNNGDGNPVISPDPDTELSFDSVATEEHPDLDAVQFEEINVTPFADFLQPGINILALHGLNINANDSDFLMVSKLEQPILSLAADVNRYFTSPNPGACNCSGVEVAGFVADTTFDVDRGFYTEPFEVSISTETEGAQIYYTINTSKPAPDNPSAILYTVPIPISSTTTLRAAAFKDDYLSTDVDTHTYIFIDDVIGQGSMSTVITNDSVWGPQMADALVAIPTISLVTPNNISETERGTSIELIYPDGTKGFQVNAGIEEFGNTWQFPKNSMRISFKNIYGPAKLHFDLFGNGATEEFDQILLRSGSHDTPFWTHPAGERGAYIRNRWMSDRQLEMGQPAPHGYFVHVYINGVYWGQYHLNERANAPFMASYFGGDKEEYDALNKGNLVSGPNLGAWNTMVASTGNYDLLEQYMDVANYADYMVLNFYGGNDWDWNPYQNWMAAGKRQGGTGFKFFCWDSDLVLRTSPTANVIEPYPTSDPYVIIIPGGPAGMWSDIAQHEEFRMLLADRTQRYFYNNGILTYDRVLASLNELASGIEKSIIPECARFGIPYGYTPTTWENAMNWIKTQFIVQRTETVIQQMRDAGVFPLIDAPVFNINGSYQHGGHANAGDKLSISQSGSGTIWYTVNGIDPRLVGGSINPNAVAYSAALTLTDTVHVKARVLDDSTWSALNEAVFAVGPVLENLRITEIMYHPAEPNTEYVELKNIGTEPVNLNLVSFTNGIDITFSAASLDPNQYILVVEDQSEFENAYGMGHTIAGEYIGALENAGEKIILVDAVGAEIHNFNYKDSWYDITDGAGFSLTIKDPCASDPNLWDNKSGWRPSASVGGSPGEDDSSQVPEPGAIKINELLSHSDTELYDWIELYNTTDEIIDIGGWFLSDNNNDDPNRMRYEIAEGTTIDPNDYIVFYENEHFGNPADQGCHKPFALSENGETVYLQSGQDGVLTGYYDEEDFGASQGDVAFGRYQKSTGAFNFVAMSSNTPGSVNAYPKVGPIVITEIMYHPLTNSDAEYVELQNISGSPVTLYDADTGISWRFVDDKNSLGIEYHFPTAIPVTVAHNEKILLVKNLAAFTSEYGSPNPSLQVFEWTTGSLSNGGEKPEIQLPGDVDELFTRYYIRVDRISYDDATPWPTEPDGSGQSLTRTSNTAYGNDAANWQTQAASPGL